MSEYLSFYVQRYFMSYLMKQHNYGANTISSYRDTFRLLLAFMAESNTDISKIEIYDISHERVLEFKWSIHKKCKVSTYKIIFSICNDDCTRAFGSMPKNT